jgi:hypothetical protein
MKLFGYNFWLVRRSLAPSKHFKKKLWSALDARWQQKVLPDYTWYHKIWFRFSIAISTCAVLVGTVSTSVYAYASPNVTEQTPLYPLKSTLEKVEVKLTPKNPEAQAKLLLKTISRKEEEKVVMRKKQLNLQNINNKIAKLDEELEKTKSRISTSSIEVNKKIYDRLQKRKVRLEMRDTELRNGKEQLKNSFLNIATTTRQFVSTTPRFGKKLKNTGRHTQRDEVNSESRNN